jgi:multidrug efflux pump subunit AcrA (membrane-fusion protein)
LFAGIVAFSILVVSTTVAAQDLQVTSGDFTRHFLMSGELVAEDAVVLVVPNARIWPVTVRWIEEDGTEVAKGDPIVEFDNSQLASNLEQLERSALEAANQLSSLQATVRGEEIEALLTFERAKATLEKARLDADVPPSLLSEQEYEERRLAFERAQLEFKQAESALVLKRTSVDARIEKQRVALAKAESAARRAREGIELLTLVAPRDGILLVSDNEEEGRPFQSGDTTWPGRSIARLPNLSSMIAEAALFDVDDGKIWPGMPVTATVDAFPELVLPGKIIEVDEIASQTNRDSLKRVFRTRVRLQGLDLERMRPGMSVKVVVEDRRADVLLVPRAALGWSESGSGGAVVVGRADGSVDRVRIGPCNREDCVLEGDLAEGDRLSVFGDGRWSGAAGGEE